MSTTRQPERRFPLSRSVYLRLRNGPKDTAAWTQPARVGVRAAESLESGTITVESAVDRLRTAGLPVGQADTPSLDQITAARLVLEPAVTVRACAAATPDDRELLRRRAGFLGSAAGLESTPRRLFRHDCDAHGLLYRLAAGGVAQPDPAGLCTLAHQGWAGRDPDAVVPLVRGHLAELGDVLRAVAAGAAGRARELATAHVWGTHLMLLQAGADRDG